MNGSQSLSTRRFLTRDYTLVATYVGVVFFWLILLLVSILGGETRSFLLTAVAMILFLPAAAVYRYVTVCRLLGNGRDGKGEVRELLRQGVRWRVLFSYSLDGRDYRGIHAFVSIRKSAPLHRGARVRIKIDPRQPRRSLIPFLYE